MNLTHFTCSSVGISGTTDVVMREIPGGFEARVGIAILGRTNMSKADLKRLTPFDPEFHDNYGRGLGSTRGLALAALRRDLEMTADTLLL